jgi:hypothetical protein
MIWASSSPVVVDNFKKSKWHHAPVMPVAVSIYKFEAVYNEMPNKELQRQMTLTGGSLSVNRKPGDSG